MLLRVKEDNDVSLLTKEYDDMNKATMTGTGSTHAVNRWAVLLEDDIAIHQAQKRITKVITLATLFILASTILLALKLENFKNPIPLAYQTIVLPAFGGLLFLWIGFISFMNDEALGLGIAVRWCGNFLGTYTLIAVPMSIQFAIIRFEHENPNISILQMFLPVFVLAGILLIPTAIVLKESCKSNLVFLAYNICLCAFAIEFFFLMEWKDSSLKSLSIATFTLMLPFAFHLVNLTINKPRKLYLIKKPRFVLLGILASILLTWLNITQLVNITSAICVLPIILILILILKDLV